jgi:hypothetical protein
MAAASSHVCWLTSGAILRWLFAGVRLESDKRSSLQRALRGLADLLLDHGGKFYFKDSILTPNDTLRVHGAETLDRFFAHKRRRVFATRGVR